MSEQDLHAAGSAAGAAASPLTAGAMLRQSREAAGLTIDAAAQQLKLAPRQVRAIEEGDFTALPGRTFVRGFVRNYARLLHLDSDVVLGALPGATAGPALEAPTLHPTAPSIGELPTTEPHRPGWTRWAIPLTLAAIVAAAAVYEFLRPGAETRHGDLAETVTAPADPASAVPAPPPDTAASTPLPNPIASAVSPSGGGTDAVPALPAASPAAPSVSPAATVGPAAPSPPPVVATPAMPPAAKAPAPVSAKAGAATVTHAAIPAPEPPAVADATLALAFRDYSWVEVKDRNGRVLLSRMNAGGTTESVSGAPPLDVVIGNAGDVKVTFRGKPVDLAPYTRQNVAKVVLP